MQVGQAGEKEHVKNGALSQSAAASSNKWGSMEEGRSEGSNAVRGVGSKGEVWILID